MRQSFLTLLAFVGSSMAAVYTVVVGIDETNGQPGLGFDPSAIHPGVGDTITFSYSFPEYLKNPPVVQHSATESTFENPCTPKSGGFDTGVKSTGSQNSNTGESFDFTVKDDNPIWFFSSVGNDCTSGMVLAVNAPATGDQTAAAFKARAIALGGGGSESTTVTLPGTTLTASAPGSSTTITTGAPPSSSNSAGSPSSSGSAPPASGTPSAAGALKGGMVTAVLGAVSAAFFGL